jgi:hypothetical protein
MSNVSIECGGCAVICHLCVCVGVEETTLNKACADEALFDDTALALF